MVDQKRFGLNRIAAPGLGLGDFYELAAKVGIGKVELRNDIGDGAVIDGMEAKEALALATRRGVRVISINAVQKFNLASARQKARSELLRLLDLCGRIACPAIVLCPNNDAGDARDTESRFAETVDALRDFGPLFEKQGILGLVEPLGFGISSLASVGTAVKAIRLSGFSCYRIVVDTFHNHIGPDGLDELCMAAEAGLVGLVHISGVEEKIPAGDFRDGHRILPGPKDVMGSKAIMKALDAAGYKGDISFEPFSEAVQRLSPDALAGAIGASMSWLSA